MRLFTDRTDAGRQLAKEVARRGYGGPETVVLGLPRGGVTVAAQVALEIGSPLDVIIVRKLGVPWHRELAMGAIGEQDVKTIDEEIVSRTGVSPAEIGAVEARERSELERRAELVRAVRPRVPLAGRTAVIVDDGIATGSTARAACRVARVQGAKKVVLAAPVAAVQSFRELGHEADEVICVDTPEPFWAIGEFYADFRQTSDEEVIRTLREQASRLDPGLDAGKDAGKVHHEDVMVTSGSVRLHGRLSIPGHPLGIVVFAHGSGSSRHSPRNLFVADELNRHGLGTLLFDLLTSNEEGERHNVFDIGLLGNRLITVSEWVRARSDSASMALGYFGASTGAAAALWAASHRNDIVAIVSRGGRPDLAGARLPYVKAPTLLIVGGRDPVVEDLNRDAQRQLRCESELVTVPGATHLFEEPGALQRVSELARDWFRDHIAKGRETRRPDNEAQGQ